MQESFVFKDIYFFLFPTHGSGNTHTVFGNPGRMTVCIPVLGIYGIGKCLYQLERHLLQFLMTILGKSCLFLNFNLQFLTVGILQGPIFELRSDIGKSYDDCNYGFTIVDPFYGRFIKASFKTHLLYITVNHLS